MKRVLLTGTGTKGFVGKNLKESLCDKYDLFTTTSSELDLRDFESVRNYIRDNKIESVILSAATAEDALDANLRLFFNIEQLSGELDKVIYFGSGAEFDKRYDIVMVSEADLGKRIPMDPYGFSKYIMAKHARGSKNIYCLRLFGIFGKYEDYLTKFISNLCCKAVFDLPFTIRKECRFDYISIEDLPPVVEWMLDNQLKDHDTNFVSGRPILLTEIAELVKTASGKDLETTLLDSDGMNNEYTASNQRLLEQFPWMHITPIEEAIGKLYQYYESCKTQLDRTAIENSR